MATNKKRTRSKMTDLLKGRTIGASGKTGLYKDININTYNALFENKKKKPSYAKWREEQIKKLKQLTEKKENKEQKI